MTAYTNRITVRIKNSGRKQIPGGGEPKKKSAFVAPSRGREFKTPWGSPAARFIGCFGHCSLCVFVKCSVFKTPAYVRELWSEKKNKMKPFFPLSFSLLFIPKKILAPRNQLSNFDANYRRSINFQSFRPTPEVRSKPR